MTIHSQQVVQLVFHFVEVGRTSYNFIIRLSGHKARSCFFV